MSQHSSLRLGKKSKQHRSVLTRAEKIKKLKEEDKWQEGTSVFGLPKIKMLRFKIKKEKAAPAAEEAAVLRFKIKKEKAAPAAEEAAVTTEKPEGEVKSETQQQKPVTEQKTKEGEAKSKKKK